MVQLRDDRGKVLHLAEPPRRLVSLVPSDTYSLVALGAAPWIVGRTRYCIAPVEVVEAIEVVGGTKDPDVRRIVELAPDLVIANQEENSRGSITELEDAGQKVLVSFPRTVAQALAHVARLARVLEIAEAPLARELIKSAYRAHNDAEAARAGLTPVRAFVPIWMDPLMTVDGRTFISDVLALVGAQNVFADRQRRYPLAADLGRAEPLPPERLGDRDTRYPRVTMDEVVERQPELVLLPDEPHPFTEADAEVFRALDIPAARSGRVLLCDGKDLMWYGARCLEGIARLRALVTG
jgi:ABC-type Fe3+-hydroxamate transport system substrate-binding protein